MRPKGNAEALEQRRRAAVAMLRQGMKSAAVAKALGVSRASVSRWRKALRSGGAKALSARPVPGRPPKLDVTQRQRIARLLLQGPIRHGYETQLWTLDRVSEVIERHLGVSYPPGHVWRILLNLGWSCQKPESRARERDEKAIARWRKVDWPRIKKSRQDRQNHPFSG
jgi:transposase